MILRRPRDRQAEFQALERLAGAGGRLLGEVGERCEIAVALRQHVGEVGRDLGVDRLQVDHVIALDHAQAQPSSQTTIFMAIDAPDQPASAYRHRTRHRQPLRASAIAASRIAGMARSGCRSIAAADRISSRRSRRRSCARSRRTMIPSCRPGQRQAWPRHVYRRQSCGSAWVPMVWMANDLRWEIDTRPRTRRDQARRDVESRRLHGRTRRRSCQAAVTVSACTEK